MLWYKSWLETRWRFLIGLALLMLLRLRHRARRIPKCMKLLPLAPRVDLSGELGRRIAEAVELSRSYRGYVWSQWFRQNMPQMWTLFAVLLGTGGLLSQASGGGALFTLSLPVSRNRLLGVRAATGLAELLVLALVPSLAAAAAVAGHRADLQRRRRARPRRVHVRRRLRVLQPRVPAVHRVQRRVASAADRPLRGGRAGARRAGLSRPRRATASSGS